MSIFAMATKRSATAIGFIAVLMWSLLALFTDRANGIPPFQLAGMTFFIGTIVGLIWTYTHKSVTAEVQVPLSVAVFGGIGLFAYHALYFAALKNAPAVEASLIAYLWPLLIVLFSAMLPGEKLMPHHVIGALLGFAGTLLIITGGVAISVNADYAFGYALAFAAAFTWTAYSLLSRRVADMPTKIVVFYCAISAVFSIFAHFLFEETVTEISAVQWSAILGLGFLPVGAAFYLWDHGMKRGDIQVLGASSYAAPLLSTIILIVFGDTHFSWSIFSACVLITFGAAVAARDVLFRRTSS